VSVEAHRLISLNHRGLRYCAQPFTIACMRVALHCVRCQSRA